MFFFFVLGTKDIEWPLKGYEGVSAQCHHCGNYDTYCMKRWPTFTFCFVPILPLSFHSYKEIKCRTCRVIQDLKARPDIQPTQLGAQQHVMQPQHGYPVAPPGPAYHQGYPVAPGQGQAVPAYK